MEPESTEAVGWKARVAATWRSLPRPMRVVMAATGGVTLIAAGVVMLVLPGPGLLVIALGVGLLATEFAWAQHVMHHGRRHARRMTATAKSAVRRPRTADAASIDPPPTEQSPTEPSTTREPS